MEAVIFTGIQASGKSTYYKEKFFKTHIRINLDMLKTRKREDILVKACIKAKQPFVVDNTNPTVEDRKKYIDIAKEANFKVTGYYFKSGVKEAILRNKQRKVEKQIPKIAIYSTNAKIKPPCFNEGYDELYVVSINKNNNFIEIKGENCE